MAKDLVGWRRGGVQACRWVGGLADEEHFLVGGEWPEVIGDEVFELFGEAAGFFHEGDEFIAEVASFGGGCIVVVLCGGFDEGEGILERLGGFEEVAKDVGIGAFTELAEEVEAVCKLALVAEGSGEDLCASDLDHEAGFDEEGAVVLFEEDGGTAFDFA